MVGSQVKFSVVIPTLDEEATISKCLEQLRVLSPDLEIIVADGGSTDRTIEIASKQQVLTCCSERGRGIQCNAGARLASGEVLIFLHADTELSPNAIEKLNELFHDDHVQIGTCQLKFDVRHWLLDLYTWAAKLPFIRFGDQGIIVRRSFFNSLDGFNNWPLFEDLDLMRRAVKRTRLYRFPVPVTTSARRFISNGILRQEILNVWYALQYLLGKPPEYLSRQYERTKKEPRNSSLILFVRFPHPGETKTRLAASFGQKVASQFYRLCAEHIFRESGRLSRQVKKYVFSADRDDAGKIQRWVGSRFYVMAQIQGDLGQKLKDAFGTAFSHGAEKAIIVASDVPDLSAEILNEAVDALKIYDIVIGPCHDGGYYLIGMKKLHAGLFSGISWSTEHVFRQTMSTINSMRLSVHILPTLTDIDTGEDLRRWLATASGNQTHRLRDFAQSLSI